MAAGFQREGKLLLFPEWCWKTTQWVNIRLIPPWWNGNTDRNEAQKQHVVGKSRPCKRNIRQNLAQERRHRDLVSEDLHRNPETASNKVYFCTIVVREGKLSLQMKPSEFLPFPGLIISLLLSDYPAPPFVPSVKSTRISLRVWHHIQTLCVPSRQFSLPLRQFPKRFYRIETDTRDLVTTGHRSMVKKKTLCMSLDLGRATNVIWQTKAIKLKCKCHRESLGTTQASFYQAGMLTHCDEW